MRQKILLAPTSSAPSGNDGHFDAGNTSTSDTADHECLNELFVGLIHLTTSLKNQMQNTSKCIECRQIISSITDNLDLLHSYMTCEDCYEILSNGWNFWESVILKTSPTLHISIRFSCPQTKKPNEEINILKNEIDTVNNNIQHLDGEFIRLRNSLQRLSQECSSSKMNCQQQSTSINELKLNQDMSEQDLLAIRQKIEDLHYATFDGSLIWIINDVARKFREAESGQQTSIDSSIFYSSSDGYNMRARLYLYGDGDVRGTHMSMYLVILKGEFDAILEWPFNFQVNLCLFDQTGQGYHIIDSFYPDTTSISFQRPTSNENIASGILKFCPLADIEQQGSRYVQNDTMFIKIMLDFLGTPRSMLPYTLGLNPGLPMHEQEAQRHTEIEKYKQARAALDRVRIRNDQETAELSLIPALPQVPAGIRQQLPSSTTDSQSISCEDIPNNE